MIEVKEEPIKEIVIHYKVEDNIENLIISRITPTGVLPLFWCDGIVYYFSSAPLQDEVLSDYIKNNRVHWTEIHYAKMSNYQPTITLNDDILNNQIKVRVIDLSNSELHKAVAAWLKKNGA